jgi:hypothetical protein
MERQVQFVGGINRRSALTCLLLHTSDAGRTPPPPAPNTSHHIHVSTNPHP